MLFDSTVKQSMDSGMVIANKHKQGSWLELLENLTESVQELEEIAITSNDVVIGITKDRCRDTNTRLFLITLTRKGKEKPCEQYLLDPDGVYRMFFEYPPMTGVPPAPVADPTLMSQEQRNEWAYCRAEKVADFIRSRLS